MSFMEILANTMLKMTARRQSPDFLVRPQPNADVTESMPDVYTE
jgi:hypothetical protein